MADSKITDLPTYTSASATPNGADVFAIVDVDATVLLELPERLQ